MQATMQDEAIPSHEAMLLRPKGTHLSSRDTGDELGQQGGEVKALGAANLQTALDRIRAQRIRSNACSIGRRGTVEEWGGVELERQTNCKLNSIFGCGARARGASTAAWSPSRMCALKRQELLALKMEPDVCSCGTDAGGRYA
jgi:hypothetical protein